MRALIITMLLAGCSGGGQSPDPVQCGGPVLTDAEVEGWAYYSFLVSTAASLDVRIDFTVANKCHEPCAEMWDETQMFEPDCRIDVEEISMEMRKYFPDGQCNPIEWGGRVGCCIPGMEMLDVNGQRAPGVAFVECL